jgi:hypothetical protein
VENIADDCPIDLYSQLLALKHLDLFRCNYRYSVEEIESLVRESVIPPFTITIHSVINVGVIHGTQNLTRHRLLKITPDP